MHWGYCVGRSQLLSAQQHVEQELMQTRQTLQHYVALGEKFASLATEHHEVLAEIENKRWALTELAKS